MPKWDHAEVADNWESREHKYSSKDVAEMEQDGWVFSEARDSATRVRISYFLVGQGDTPDRLYLDGWEKAIAQMGAEGFELVAFSEVHRQGSGHRRWWFKRDATSKAD